VSLRVFRAPLNNGIIAEASNLLEAVTKGKPVNWCNVSATLNIAILWGI
jgi:hypothetical protein